MAKGTLTNWPESHGTVSPVRWADVAATVRAIADSSDTSLDTVGRLVIGFTEPLRQLDRLPPLPAPPARPTPGGARGARRSR
mgnify:CR=1 FL=1